MSGGALTDMEYDLFRLDDWAKKIDEENPLLAEHMHDLYNLLHVYDEYMSGDGDEESVENAWTEYRSKWLNVTSEQLEGHIFENIRKEVESYIESFRLGHGRKQGWQR